MPSQNQFYKRSKQTGSLFQCEIISGLPQFMLKYLPSTYEEGYALKIINKYVMVITQDCDLEQDYRCRTKGTSLHRQLPSILFCEVEIATAARQPSPVPNDPELSDYEKKIYERKLARADDFKNTNNWKKVCQNNDFRYHYLSKVSSKDDSLNLGIDPLLIDFKNIFTVPADEVYFRIKNKVIRRRCKLKSPYLEHFNSRYHFYHSRVALPQDHPFED